MKGVESLDYGLEWSPPSAGMTSDVSKKNLLRQVTEILRLF